METTDETDREPPEPLCQWSWDEDVEVEIWPAGHRSFEVTVTCGVRRARWWDWWRSDLPFPRGKRKVILDALEDAQTWLRRKGAQSPSYMELKVTFTKSD